MCFDPVRATEITNQPTDGHGTWGAIGELYNWKALSEPLKRGRRNDRRDRLAPKKETTAQTLQQNFSSFCDFWLKF